jgi:hypothetical protein
MESQTPSPDQESRPKNSNPGAQAVVILETARAELFEESIDAGKRPHDLREWLMPLKAAGVLTGALTWLKFGPRLLVEFSNAREYERAKKFFADRDARGEFETCGHCHATNKQKGLKWGKCDACGISGVFPTEAEAHKHKDSNGMLIGEKRG